MAWRCLSRDPQPQLQPVARLTLLMPAHSLYARLHNLYTSLPGGGFNATCVCRSMSPIPADLALKLACPGSHPAGAQ